MAEVMMSGWVTRGRPRLAGQGSRGWFRLQGLFVGYVEEYMFVSDDQEHVVRDPIPPGLEQWALVVIET
ncbi:hypothetical protein ACWD5Q_23190 [Streptomyces sp. NPDC002513]